MHEFASGVIDRGLEFSWFAYMQAESILRAEPSTLDLLARSGLYNCLIGAEAGTDDAMARMKKPTRGDDNLRAAMELDRRGVATLMTYIIGFPDEDAASMLATLEQARTVTLACPRARPEVWPYRPIPGTSDYRRALELGYVPPASLEAWGLVGDYWNDEAWLGRIPAEIARARRLFMHYSSLAQGRVRERRGLWERRACARLTRNDYKHGGLEARAFHLYHALEKRLRPGSANSPTSL
jgi:anaerobic magnesium-protoporphyrin IX monomethyl ester cyclase